MVHLIRTVNTRQLPVDVVRSESEVTIGATGPRYRPIAYLPPVRKMRYKTMKDAPGYSFDHQPLT